MSFVTNFAKHFKATTSTEEAPTKMSSKSGTPSKGTLDPADIEKALSQNFLKLSMKDREQAQYELHGVHDVIQESSEITEDLVQQLNDMLDNYLIEERAYPFKQVTPIRYVLEHAPHYIRKRSFLMSVATEKSY